MSKPPAFTLKSNGISRTLITDVSISEAFDPHIQKPPVNLKKYKAIWDTGATGTCITTKVAQECGLIPTGQCQIGTAGNTIDDANTYLISILLPHNFGIPSLTVMEVKEIGGADLLIGMDIITLGDFIITNKDGKTVLTFRSPSIECFDFVENLPIPIPTVKAERPCPHGNKKYQKCAKRKPN